MNLPPQQMLTAPSLHCPFLSPPLPRRHPLPCLKPNPNPSQVRFTSKSVSPTLFSTSPPSPSSPSNGPDEFEVELRRMLALLPEEMRRRLDDHPNHRHLIEVVMDLGRKPLARFPSGDFVLSEDLITSEDLQRASNLVGDFGVDNRAGISRTLHRISAIRNRKGLIIGLTCRVGRAVSGSATLLRDLVEDGSSLLLIGPPGVGKTTIIRDIARMLANDYNKRVMIVDTSNEIGGDGDIPHVGIGNARRMQVPHSDVQHKVMIEAVENHMPQVIVIDEIGTKLEAVAATTIAQRGIQLVATAHGMTIKNLVKNPLLEMLVGGVQHVILGDEEASKRGVQKTVLERKGPSTFHSGVEIVSKNELRVHRNLEATVDTVLSGRIPFFECRKLNQGSGDEMTGKQPFVQYYSDEIDNNVADGNSKVKDEGSSLDDVISEASMGGNLYEDETPFKLYIYGISETSVMEVIMQLKMDGKIKIIGNISEADGLLALLSKLKKNSRIQTAAKSLDIPIYVTKTCSLRQIMEGMRELIDDHSDGLGDSSAEGKMNISEKMDALEVNIHSGGLEDCLAEGKINISEKMDALEEARIAIEQIVIPKGEPVELLPRPLNLLLFQKELIHKYHLQSRRVGVGPYIRLQILPFQTIRDENGDSNSDEEEFDDVFTPDRETNGSAHTVSRLPLLPESAH